MQSAIALIYPELSNEDSEIWSSLLISYECLSQRSSEVHIKRIKTSSFLHGRKSAPNFQPNRKCVQIVSH